MNLASWSIRNPIPSILLFVLLTVAGIHSFTRLAVQDLPDMALPSVSLVAALPGATPAQLETEIARPIEDALAAIDGLRHVTTAISDGAVQIEASFVLEKPLSEALIQTKDAVDAIRSDLPADMLHPSVSASSFVFAPVMAYAVTSSRRDEEALSWFIDDRLTKAVRGVPGVGKVERLGGVQREVRVTVDPVRLAALGVTAGDVSRALREVQQQSSGGRGQLGGGEQSVRTIATVAQASELAALPIVVAGGRQVRLDQVATVEDGAAERTQVALLDGKPASVASGYHPGGDAGVSGRLDRAAAADSNRYDRERYISVTADLNGMAQGDALARIDALPTIRAMPSGVALIPAGGAEIGEEVAGGFAVALIAGVLCIYCVLVLLFRDFLQPLTILSAIPLSIGGAFVALLLGGSALDMPAMIGLIMLTGIVTKNSILLVEYAILGMAERGLPRTEALIEACRNRARPIIMTTVAMIAGMAPIALGFGADASFRQPMAIAVIGGLITSTALSLLVVPVVFALVDSLERRLRFSFAKHRNAFTLLTSKDEQATASGADAR